MQKPFNFAKKTHKTSKDSFKNLLENCKLFL